MPKIVNKGWSKSQIYNLLEDKVNEFNQTSFIELDPISVPHLFTKKEDIEIAGFFAASFAWGQRTTIINKSKELMNLMEMQPHDFVLNHSDKDLKSLLKFKHRTFNSDDLLFFIESLKNIYNNGGLEKSFSTKKTAKEAIDNFRNTFLKTEHLKRSEKHISSPAGGSAAKRLNMFLRWMVRKDKNGVDFGIWKNIKPSELMCPLDVHSGNIARRLGLLNSQLNNWKSVEELTNNLKKLDKNDPVKYDFALFGLGVNDKEKVWKT